jgi:two-component system, LytTR family, response regulator
MKAIIVDDEPKAIELIKGYLGHFSNVETVATFRNGLKAFEYLNSNPVDLIFLDINMPHISGISLSKMLDKKVKIIFTTAYSEYAVESYDVGAVDYLLKPITLERFMVAMGKVMDTGNHNQDITPAFLWVKSGGKNFKLTIDDMLYLKKEGNYMTYFTKETKVIARESIAEALANLPSFFYQTHKSYIINSKQVTALEKDSLFINEIEIPIGLSFREELREILNNSIR